MLDDAQLSMTLDQARIYTDQDALSKIKAKGNSPEAIRAAAKEFESLYINMMFQSMRKANQVFSDGNALNSREMDFFRQMLDSQYSMELSQSGGIGIAEILIEQLSPDAYKNENPFKSAEPNALSGFSDFIPPHVPSSGLGNYKPSASALSLEAAKASLEKNQLGLMTDGEQEAGISIDARADEEGDFPHSLTQSIFGDAESLDWPSRPAATYSETYQSSSAFTERQPTHFETPEMFIQTMFPLAQRASKTLGVDPKLLVAQAALETGWGKHIMGNGQGGSSFNLFGIKARLNQQSVEKETIEYEGKEAKKMQDQFRVYEDYESSFEDYVDLVTASPRYAKARAQSQHSENYIQALQQAGYATDPKYADKVLSVLNRIERTFQTNTFAAQNLDDRPLDHQEDQSLKVRLGALDRVAVLGE